MDNAILAGAIGGLTELIKRLRARDYWAAATIVSSGLVGFLLGLLTDVQFVVVGTHNNALAGLIVGLAVSGAISIVGSLGAGNAPIANRLNIFKNKQV